MKKLTLVIATLCVSAAFAVYADTTTAPPSTTAAPTSPAAAPPSTTTTTTTTVIEQETTKQPAQPVAKKRTHSKNTDSSNSYYDSFIDGWNGFIDVIGKPFR